MGYTRNSFVPLAAAYQCCILLTSMLLASAQKDVYIVTVEGDPVVKNAGLFPKLTTANDGSVAERKAFIASKEAKAYSAHLTSQHDMLLKATFGNSTYRKLYSYHHVMNGFAVHVSADQAEALSKLPGVKRVEKDWRIQKMTVHTPDFLGLPTGIWPLEGGIQGAGEGVIIGIIDTGIDPTHPSFSADAFPPYSPIDKFYGKCEQPANNYGSFCNGKIVGAQHFSAAAETSGAFNSSTDFASPLDGDGHGSHTASTAAGNHGIPVVVDGFYFGNASGMAPRARIAVYKALYRLFGGFVADVVAAVDQAVADGVDVLNLSVGPSSPPSSTKTTFLNAFDVALLSAVKAGIFVVQAAGNGGPFPRTMASFSPWIVSVAAGLDDRSYGNSIVLGNGEKLSGAGLAPATPGDQLYDLVLAEDALVNNTSSLFNPTTCQQPAAFNITLVKGKVLICTYSFSFIFGGSTIKRVSETALNLSAVGFVLVAKTELPGTKFSPVPIKIPGIVILNLNDSQLLMDYYNGSTMRDSNGDVLHSNAQAKIGNGLTLDFHGAAPQVAMYSSRGPDVKNFNFQDADVLKPDILAPGSLIWAAWSPIGIDQPDFQGQTFAMMSGTSMATPHIAGIAALLKQKHPDWSPAAIASAIMTTASIVDSKGGPVLAQHFSIGGGIQLQPATPFDFGAGAVNATAALDPGLIFDAGYKDYINFICSVTGVDSSQVLNATGSSCESAVGLPTDLNTPSITIANLSGTQTITRTVTNVAKTENYTISYFAPTGISVKVDPTTFKIMAGQSISFSVTLMVASSSSKEYNFGEVSLMGDQGHRVSIPIAIRAGDSNK